MKYLFVRFSILYLNLLQLNLTSLKQKKKILCLNVNIFNYHIIDFYF